MCESRSGLDIELPCLQLLSSVTHTSDSCGTDLHQRVSSHDMSTTGVVYDSVDPPTSVALSARSVLAASCRPSFAHLSFASARQHGAEEVLQGPEVEDRAGQEDGAAGGALHALRQVHPAALRGPGQPGVLAEGRELREEILLRPEGLGHALLGELRALPPAEEGALDEIVHDSGIGRVPDREQEGRSRDDGEADRPLRR